MSPNWPKMILHTNDTSTVKIAVQTETKQWFYSESRLAFGWCDPDCAISPEKNKKQKKARVETMQTVNG